MANLTRGSIALVVGAFVLTARAVVAFGQWPDYRISGPRTPDGKIDLAAAPPKTHTGKSDFSGL